MENLNEQIYKHLKVWLKAPKSWINLIQTQLDYETSINILSFEKYNIHGKTVFVKILCFTLQSWNLKKITN